MKTPPLAAAVRPAATQRRRAVSATPVAAGHASRHLAIRLALLLPLLVGAWFRSDQLGSQVLIEDEWHALHKLLGSGYADIASHFGYADYSIPLTLVDRWLYRCGLLRVRSTPFIVATAIGSLPGTVAFVLAGASIDNLSEGFGGIDTPTLVASVVLIVASLVASRLLRRRAAPAV